jgi:ATP-binding cassette, subfamily B, multidrug efflux pump
MRGAGKTEDMDYKALDFTLLKRLIVYLKPYKFYVFISIILTLFTSFLGPLRPYLTKIAIDDYITKNDTNGLLLIIAGIFGVLVVHGIIQFALTYLMQWVGQKVLLDIRVRLFSHIHNLGMKYHDGNPVGRTVTRVTNDIEALNELFSSGIVMIFADVLLIVWIIGFMIFINLKLALFILLFLPVLFLLTFIFRTKIRTLYRDIRKIVARINSFLNELITGITTIKIFSVEKEQSRAFSEINDSHRKLLNKTIYQYASFFALIEILSSILLGLVLWYTAGNYLKGLMTLGTIIAFIQYAEMLFRPIRDLTEKYTTLQSAMAASERIFLLLDTEDEKSNNGKSKLVEFKDSIKIEKLLFSYEENKPVLQGINLEIKKGETLAIVGLTGGGKTTIINLLTRFYEFKHGSIKIDGRDIREFDEQSVRSKIAIVMQDVFMFSRSVAENISLGNKDITFDRIKNAAESLGAAEFIENLPGGYDFLLNEQGSVLSSGQRQILSFCRAFAYNPEILILDEATSNIDSATERIIETATEKLLSGRTSIVIAHRLSTIKKADKIIVLHHGVIKESGTHKELIDNNGLYSKLYRLQYEKK